MRVWRFEVSFNDIARIRKNPNVFYSLAGILSMFVPSPFKHQDVQFDDEFYADEYGMFWMGLRFSYYGNLMTPREMFDRRK